MKKKIIYCLMLIGCFAVNPSYASDFDDDIELDEPIDDSIKLKPNIQFIKRNALAKANRAKKNNGCTGTGNLTFETGANLKGATIVNLSNNKGTSAVCVTR
jgi:hypothetical protein